MVREESTDETHSVDDEETEHQTHEPGDESQSTIYTGKTVFGKRERNRDRCGDQHHPRDSTNAEDEKV